MRTRPIPTAHPVPASRRHWPIWCVSWALAWCTVVFWGVCGCHKDLAGEATDSDANGYVCLKCGAKLYTPRSVFIGPQCPKCRSDELVEVVGYLCERDGHLSIKPHVTGRDIERLCDKCQQAVNTMKLPREKDLKEWGATKPAL